MNYKFILEAIEDGLSGKQLLIDYYKKENEQLKKENEELKQDITMVESQLIATQDQLQELTQRGTEQCE